LHRGHAPGLHKFIMLGFGLEAGGFQPINAKGSLSAALVCSALLRAVDYAFQRAICRANIEFPPRKSKPSIGGQFGQQTEDNP